MFTISEVNEEIQKYIKYTSYNIPTIQEIKYVDTSDYYGEVNKTEILEGKYIIRFSNSLDTCPLEYQKSVIWHEATHIMDIINNKDSDLSTLEGIMSTYSEAHAESIQLRYLLHITPKQIVNQGRRFLCCSNGKEDLSIVTANYINNSSQHLTNFIKTQSPKDFQSFVRSFSYFCGYMFLKNDDNAEKLTTYVISLYPKQYQKELRELWQYIKSRNLLGCAAIYTKLKTEAILYSFNGLIDTSKLL